MMHDFTLVIPTYNRSQRLSALLGYLEAQNADCRVLVLDSSCPEALAANRERTAASSLDLEFAEFPDLEPSEKWRQGLRKVRTPFCGLCADDDLVILEGVRHCLVNLRSNLAASMVQGYSFSFLSRPDGDMELNGIVYFRPTIDDPSPLERLDKLFQQYQALTYGVFRTPTLQRILDALQSLTQTLARELLWSALTAIGGHVIRLPHFSYGRGMAPSADRDYWHPLEWFSKDPDSLFAEYLRYRELTTAAIFKRPDNEHQLDEIHSMLDLVHLRYLAQHMPDSTVQFIVEQQIAGANFAEYWPRHEIHLPVYDAAGIRATPELETLGPMSIRGPDRSYHLFPGFYAPRGIDSPQMADIVRLINVLNSYRVEARCDPPAKGAT
jgi:glycosyltransferase domain-containing protein